MKFYDSNLLLLVCMSFTIDRAGFLIFALVFVSRDFELGRNVIVLTFEIFFLSISMKFGTYVQVDE